MSRHDEEYNLVRSLTRLAVGSLLLAGDELQRRLRQWEEETSQELAEQQRPAPATAARQPTSTGKTKLVVPLGDKLTDAGRHALIGLLFETQTRVASVLAVGQGRERKPVRRSPPSRPVLPTNPLLASLRRRFDMLVARGDKEVNALMTRGQSELERWVMLGRAEEQHSRKLVQTALQSSVETSIHHVVENEEVRELVQQQGSGLANEIVEEVRERAVSVDMLLERFIRLKLGRTPREQLPEPSDAVQRYVTRHRAPEA